MDQITPRLTQAAVWTPDGIDIRTLDIPELAPGDVLVRIDLATVCGSDLHTVSGRRPAACPSVLGHEAVGKVAAIGDGNRPAVVGDGGSLVVGDRVVWSVTVPCQQCPRCASGFTAKCIGVRKVGHESARGDWVLSGSYAEHIVLPRGTAIARVPDAMPDSVAAPAACATATVMAALEAAGALTGKRVLIFGAGMLGVTAAAASAECKAATVRVIDQDPLRQRLSRAFGAVDDDGDSTDVAIDFTGAAAAVQSAFGRLDIGGRLVLAGSVTPGPPISVDPERVVRRWLTITGIHNYEPRHLAQAIAFLGATGEQYPWAELVDTPVPLADLTRVLAPTPPGILRSSVSPHTCS
ncbi:dehydrogenase [Rhodococcus sp. WS3]|uniref:zinc-binding dehydrogenase n=1 Tax=Rhodococcus sp. WS3 TaxID=2486271 RepID=UPI001141E4A2|nr:zinc-binding dehydrogenase [Rhodococcus sp. WS3]ROZ48955.1 dehydrogenase [Rhodococcus sp. WS3]